MSLFQELKRRNVFRVGIAYAVAAWIILQLTDVIGEILELPPWGGKLILLILVIGFFLAIIFAWAFELTPEGVKRESEVDRSQSIAPRTGRKLDRLIIVLLTLGIGYLLFDKFWARPATEMAVEVTEQAEATPPSGSAPEVRRQSIAVLPFANRSNREEDEFFVEGVHDDLLTNLARIGDLKVISRTSVLRYKDTDTPIPEIANELGVATIMEGAVQRSGETVRINVQLIDAISDEHLWAEIYDRELTADNLFTIQSEISGAIARELQATLSPEEQRRLSDQPTDDLAAYSAYLRGRQLMARRTSGTLVQAMAEFERAVELDPEFALAWVSLGETVQLLPNYGTLNPKEATLISQDAATRAMAIDDQLGQPHLIMARIYENQGMIEETEAAYRRAVELSPGYATAWHWYGNFAGSSPSRLAEARSYLDKALSLDPLSSVIRMALSWNLQRQGKLDEAQAELEYVLSMDPEFPATYRRMAEIKRLQGRFDERIIWLKRAAQRDPNRMANHMDRLWAYLDIGDDQAIRGIRADMEALDEDNFQIAWLDLILAMIDRNYPAALEQNAWIYQNTGGMPFVKLIESFLHNMNRDYERARAALEIWDPQWFVREDWEEAITRDPDTGCYAGWILLNAGDEAMGFELLEMVTTYLQEELPQYTEIYPYQLVDCYAALGDFDQALESLSKTDEHRLWAGWYFLERSPMFEPIWNEPRYLEFLTNLHAELARQRENLAHLEAQETEL